MISRYDLMDNFEITNDDGNTYKDIFSYPDDSEMAQSEPVNYIMTTRELERIDMLMFEFYDASEWDDIIMWYNRVGHIADVEAGDGMILPIQLDLNGFYETNLKKTL